MIRKQTSLLDASFLNNPYPTYHALRAAGPLHWSEEFFGGAWLVPRYADVMAVLRDPRFSSRRAGGWVNGSGPAARTELREFKRIFARSLLFLNAPQHTRLRQVVNAGFKPALIEKSAPRIQAIVDQLLDKIEPAGEIDFICEVARPLPARVIADQLGVDAADPADVLAWSDDIAAFIGSPLPSIELARRAQAGVVALTDYFRAILPQRRRHLGDDLVSLLIRAEHAGKIITSKELLAQCATLLFAGIETTRNLLGNGLFALLKDLEQWQRLKQSPALVPSAVRELLRFDSPVQYTGRRLTTEVEMHGRRLKKGELVIALIGAANRDPAKFSEPDTLDISRHEGMHLSFGYGPHVCVGAALTCLEAEVAFKSLIQRLPDLQLVGDKPQWTANAVYRGLATLPVARRRPGPSFSVSPIEIPMIPTIKLHGPSKAERAAQPTGAQRWPVEQVMALFEVPFSDLVFRAQAVHRKHFDPNAVQLSTLLSIKTGGCPEDCGYCPQAARYHTGVTNQRLLSLEEVVTAAKTAKANGATRFCMGAAWRGPRQKNLEPVLQMVRAVKALGLETCATLGMLKDSQAEQLKHAGLDYYNHNLDTAPEFYGEIITTRVYQDRLDTLQRVRNAGIHVCCGGIVGLGETRRQRAGLIAQLAGMDPPPESVPINNLVQVEGTPLYGTDKLDPFEFVRTIAVARITMPTSFVRLSAGRQRMGEAVQALCFLAGANSIFYGDKLLTTGNPETAQDQALFEKLGLRPR